MVCWRLWRCDSSRPSLLPLSWRQLCRERETARHHVSRLTHSHTHTQHTHSHTHHQLSQHLFRGDMVPSTCFTAAMTTTLPIAMATIVFITQRHLLHQQTWCALQTSRGISISILQSSVDSNLQFPVFPPQPILTKATIP